MSRLALYLTLPGFGGSSAVAPPAPPAAPPPAPTPMQAETSRQRADSLRRSRNLQGIGGTIRNVGGSQGLSIGDTQRALKSLTGM